MLVKWVCADCSSNNLCKSGVLLRCAVCGKLRTDEPLQKVAKTEYGAEIVPDSAPADSPLTLRQILPFLRYRMSHAKRAIPALVSVAAAVMVLFACQGILNSPAVFLDNLRQLRQRNASLISSLSALADGGERAMDSGAHVSQFARNLRHMRAILSGYDALRAYSQQRLLDDIHSRLGIAAVNLGLLLKLWKSKRIRLADFIGIWRRLKAIILRL